jgi:hypothetical protein
MPISRLAEFLLVALRCHTVPTATSAHRRTASPLAFDHPSLFQWVMVIREMPLAEIEWKPLPTPMWPEGSVMADWSGLILEASFEQGVPTRKVQRSMGKNALPILVASGTADSVAAAKAAALHTAEAALRSPS